MSALLSSSREANADKRFKNNYGLSSTNDLEDLGPDDRIFETGLHIRRVGKRFLKKREWDDRGKCEEMLSKFEGGYRQLRDSLLGECKVIYTNRCSKLTDLIGETQDLYDDIQKRCQGAMKKIWQVEGCWLHSLGPKRDVSVVTNDRGLYGLNNSKKTSKTKSSRIKEDDNDDENNSENISTNVETNGLSINNSNSTTLGSAGSDSSESQH